MPAPKNCIGMAPESLDRPRRGGGASSQEEKEDLRRSMRRLRAAIPPAERARLAELIEEAVFGVPEVRQARTILLFYSFGTEVATAGMTQRILGSGRRLLLPYLADDGTMEAAEVRPGDPLEPTEYGPREPSTRIAVAPETVDVVVTPALAFDRRGNRLGYGGGYYDRYLRHLGGRALRVGVGFSLQLVDRVPVEPDDQRVHLVVTDQGVLDVRP